MADENPNSVTEPFFRATKRRKIFRKRTEDDGSNDAAGTAPSDIASMSASVDEAASTEPVMSRMRKPVGRKHGIAFTSASHAPREADASEETAMVPVHPDREQRIGQGDRFVKPTGKAAVVDDKHMTAFVDSKLAEMRSATSAQDTLSDSEQPNPHTEGQSEGRDRAETGRPASDSTGNPQHQHRKPRTQRQSPARGANDIARDSLIESIMRESAAAPLYNQSAFNTPAFSAHDGNALDNDEAAAEAFKAQFLQDMEEQNRRWPPNPTPFSKVAQTKGADRMAHGPKLGGSRSQRERMKAAQAAAELEGKKK